MKILVISFGEGDKALVVLDRVDCIKKSDKAIQFLFSGGTEVTTHFKNSKDCDIVWRKVKRTLKVKESEEEENTNLEEIHISYEKLKGLLKKAKDSLSEECAGVVDLVEYLEELLGGKDSNG